MCDILVKCDYCGTVGTENMIEYDVPNDKYYCKFNPECVKKHASQSDDDDDE
jgi:hypothetical protein